jgi:hypothetical protein
LVLVVGFAVVVVERLEPGDDPDAAPEDLVRAGVIANVLR